MLSLKFEDSHKSNLCEKTLDVDYNDVLKEFDLGRCVKGLILDKIMISSQLLVNIFVSPYEFFFLIVRLCSSKLGTWNLWLLHK